MKPAQPPANRETHLRNSLRYEVRVSVPGVDKQRIRKGLGVVPFGISTASLAQRLASIQSPECGGIPMHTLARLNANLVSLRKAVLCANCDMISDGENGHCVACGSQALLSLSRLLGCAIESDSLPIDLTEEFTAGSSKPQYLSAAA
jgi:hypothetical protein